MSSDIWTQCAGSSEIRPLRPTPFRVVESQHQVATRKLVDTLEEQALLEELIDGAKPPDNTGGRQHYLLWTPFRYPPLRHGSRFGSSQERGIWYGAETIRTAMTEVAYYRLVFLEGTTANLGMLTADLTSFRVRVRATRAIDLTHAPFTRFHDAIASPVEYTRTQALGTAMRADGVELCRYPSARDDGGVNVAAFVVTVFGRSAPHSYQGWRCTATRDVVEVVRRDLSAREQFIFSRNMFLVDGRLPSPAV